VKATLKPEYAANFEFVDASGNVLPDASVSTSHEFNYNDGSNSGREDSEWYRKLLYMFLGVLGAISIIILLIVILVIVLIRRVKLIGEQLIRSNDRNNNGGKTSDNNK
ncbi:MAG: hypothetical protein HFH71_03300, partial [Clostridia bacterium]|nr:hypothetical protein [Clostridia bacterium]